MTHLGTQLARALHPERRKHVVDHLLGGRSFADFETPTITAQIATIYPGDLSRTLAATERATGNVTLMRMDREGNFVSSESRLLVEGSLQGVKIAHFEVGPAPSELQCDMILSALRPEQRVKRSAA